MKVRLDILGIDISFGEKRQTGARIHEVEDELKLLSIKNQQYRLATGNFLFKIHMRAI
jgi:hypothetical protein